MINSCLHSIEPGVCSKLSTYQRLQPSVDSSNGRIHLILSSTQTNKFQRLEHHLLIRIGSNSMSILDHGFMVFMEKLPLDAI